MNASHQQRAELHRTLWAIANDLRGSIDGWDFKIYVLGMLFYRYLSEALAAYVTELDGTDYTTVPDAAVNEAIRTQLIEEKGFYLAPSELFCNVLARAESDKDLNVTLDTVFKMIENPNLRQKSEEAEKGLCADLDVNSQKVGATVEECNGNSENVMKGLFSDFDVNSPKLGTTPEECNCRLVKLMRGVADMQLGSLRDASIDAFGDAYEYLMSMYASSAGKSGGEFFTPQEVSRLLARLALGDAKNVGKVYDPACGSGSLLLQVARLAGEGNIDGLYGQEINLTTYNLCRINMFLHGMPFEKFNITHGDTLTSPRQLDDGPFDAIVSNPPYSINWAGKDKAELAGDVRFNVAGALAPKSKADLAFVMHSLSQLKEGGRAAIVCFPGVFYRGGAEKTIRSYLVDQNVVDAVVQLPANLFFGTSIATCILVLRKPKTDTQTDTQTDRNVLFVDASDQCVKVTKNNTLADEHIDQIVTWVKNREAVPHRCALVSADDLKKGGYNLSVNTWIEPEDRREVVDIEALNAELTRIVAREAELRDQIDALVAQLEQ